MSRKAVWLLTLPVALAGIEAAHALANLAFGPPHRELFEGTDSGRGLLLALGALGLASIVCWFAGRVAGVCSTPRSSRSVLLPFVLLPPVGFVLIELGEALAAGSLRVEELERPTFLAGLALQLPAALAGYLLARALLRLGDELRERLRRTASRPRRSRSSRDAWPTDELLGPSFLLAASPARAPPAAA